MSFSGSIFDSVSFVKLQNGKELAAKFGKQAELLTELLVKKADALGRMPTQEEVRNDPEMPHPNVFATEFSSFEKAIEAAEYEWQRRYPEGRTVKKMGRKSTYTKEGVLELLRKKAEELERIPTARELADDPNMPSATVFKKLFGGVKAALAALMAEDIELPEELELPEDLKASEPDGEYEAPPAAEVAEGRQDVIAAEAAERYPDTSMSAEALEKQQDMPVPAEVKAKIEVPKENAGKRICLVIKIEISFPD